MIKSQIRAIIYWLPRIVGIAFILFLSMFALDVIDGQSGWSVVPALVIHLIPSLILLGIIAIAWKYEWVGAAAFFLFGVWYVWMVGLDRHWSWYAAITAPAFVVSALFLIGWMQKNRG